MPTVIPCVPCCATPLTTNIPGIAGNAGTDGDDGIASYAFLSIDMNPVPAPGGTTGSVAFSGPGTTPTAWMVVGQYVIMGDNGPALLANGGPFTFVITSVESSTDATFERVAAPNDSTTLILTAGVTCSPTGSPGTVTVATTTNLTGILTGDGSNVGAVADPLPIANGGTAAANVPDATKALTTRYRLLAKVTAADFNVVTDQAITNLPGKWIIRRITVQNASVNMTTAAGGFYTGAGKTGTVIVAAAQVYTALSTAPKWLDLTLAAGVLVGTDALTATTIYFALTTAQGAAATADIYIWGEDIS